VRDVRGLLLLVAQDDRAYARLEARQGPVLAAVHRVQHDVPRAALGRRRGTGAAHGELPGPAGERDDAERHLHRGLVDPGAVDPGVLLERVRVLAARRAGRRRGPVGLLLLAGVGDVLPAAAAQLLPDPADPVRAARVRAALSAHRRRTRLARPGADHPAVGNRP